MKPANPIIGCGVIVAVVIASVSVVTSQLASANTQQPTPTKSSQPALASAGDKADVSSVWTLELESEWAPSTSPLSVLNGHVYFSSTGFKIDAAQETLDKVPAANLARLTGHIAEVNQNIASGKAAMFSDGEARPLPAQSSAPLKGRSLDWNFQHGYITEPWYGYHVHLDSYLANKLIGGVWVGAGAAFAATELGGAPAIFGIALGTAAGALQVCQASDDSLDVYFLGLVVYNGFVCNPFA